VETIALITVTLIGPDEVRSAVTMSDDATVRDIATFRYHLFWRTLKRNGTNVLFTAKVSEGDIVTVEEE
jgi:hypothetical protein